MTVSFTYPEVLGGLPAGGLAEPQWDHRPSSLCSGLGPTPGRKLSRSPFYTGQWGPK